MRWFTSQPAAPQLEPTETVKTPLLSPPKNYIKINKPAPTPDQLLKHRQLSEITLPSILITPEIYETIPLKNGKSYQEWRSDEEKWLDQACLYRYLVACKWVVSDAAIRLEKTLIWRRSYQPHHVSTTVIQNEGSIGKVYLNGFDKFGQPIVYMQMKEVGTEDWDNGLKWSIFIMEKAIEVMPVGVEKINFMINYTDYKIGNTTPLHITRQWIDILSSHYPERLANGFHVNPNFLVWVPLKIINPFLDPVTRSKTQIVYSKNSNKKKAEQDGVIAGMGNGVIDLAEHVDVDVLERCCGGGFEFEFDSDVYLGELFGEMME